MPPDSGNKWPLTAMMSAVVWVGQVAHAGQLPPMAPGDLVRKTVGNELKASEIHSRPHMFLSVKETPHGSQTKLYCETRDAMAGILLANNGKPLTAEERLAEKSRLDELSKDPEALRKKRQRAKDDEERTARIVRAMPDALLYEYDRTESAEPGSGKPGDELVRLRFRPNPRYSPPTRTEQVLEGMTGYLLIDTNQYRIARIDGTLYKDVGFGWGILGHLDKGGHFLVELGDVGDGTWDIRKISLAFTGKILLFKRLDMKSTEVFSDFRPVPDGLSFAQGVELLKKEEGILAQNQRGTNQK
jgi:hypothetical protein